MQRRPFTEDKILRFLNVSLLQQYHKASQKVLLVQLFVSQLFPPSLTIIECPNRVPIYTCSPHQTVHVYCTVPPRCTRLWASDYCPVPVCGEAGHTCRMKCASHALLP